jgi:hypothetical protein
LSEDWLDFSMKARNVGSAEDALLAVQRAKQRLRCGSILQKTHQGMVATSPFADIVAFPVQPGFVVFVNRWKADGQRRTLGIES